MDTILSRVNSASVRGRRQLSLRLIHYSHTAQAPNPSRLWVTAYCFCCKCDFARASNSVCALVVAFHRSFIYAINCVSWMRLETQAPEPFIPPTQYPDTISVRGRFHRSYF